MASPSSTHGGASPSTPSRHAVASTTASERLIERFGGIRPMAHKLEIPVTTVQGWKKRGVIPPNRLGDLRAAASRHGVVLDEDDLKAIGLNDDESEPAAASAPVEAAASLASVAPLSASTLGAAAPASVIAATGGPAAKAPEPAPSPAPQTVSPSPVGAAAPAPQLSPPQLSPTLTSALEAVKLPSALQNLSANAWAGLALVVTVATLVGVGIAIINTSPSALWQKRVGALEGQVSSVSTSQFMTASELANRLIMIERRLPELDRRVNASAPVGQLLAMAQLRAALVGSAPFTTELAAVLFANASDPAPEPGLRAALDRLTPTASGVATQDDLTLWFAETAARVGEAATIGDPGARLLDRVTGWMAGWATGLHRLAVDPTGTGFRTVLTEAGAALNAGDLAGAVDRLERLSGPAAEAAVPWLTAARARLTADQARALLGDHMLALSAAVLPGGAGQ